MQITAIAFPEECHAQLKAAFPEYVWAFTEHGSGEQHDPVLQGIRQWLGFKRPAAVHENTPKAPRTYVLWSGMGKDAQQTMTQTLQAKGHSILGVVYPGLINPEVSALGVSETGITSFMLLPPGDDSAGRAEPKGPQSILPADLAEAAQDIPVPKIAFVPSSAVGAALETLPKGYVLSTVPLDLPLAKTIALQRAKTVILPPNISKRTGLQHCSSVITQDALLAALAVLMGRDVIAAEAAFGRHAPLQQAFQAGKAAVEQMLVQNTRFVDIKTNQRIGVTALRKRIEEKVLPAPQNDDATLPELNADQTSCIVVGTPAGVIDPAAQLFHERNAIQAPPKFVARTLSQNADIFDGLDFIIWHRMPSIDWVRNSSGVVRILSRYACGIPMQLGQTSGFFPVLSCDRVRGLTDPDTGEYVVEYDLAADIDQLDAKQRRRLRGLGKQMLPDLARLQSTWRVNRTDVFTLTRRLGLQTRPRLLVLGTEPPKEGLPIRTNPWNIEDIDLVQRLLVDHPGAEILYHPRGADKAILTAIEHLSDRVRAVAGDLEVAELAQVVDGFHTIASPLGFAALLTQKPLTVYGKPAYAGLGLTRDLDLNGQERPLLVEVPMDLNSFIGWYYTENILFIDPLTGHKTSYKDYAKDWFPGRGDLRDSIADRLLAQLHDNPKVETRNSVLQVLRNHLKHDHAKALINAIDLTAEIQERPVAALTLAETYADLRDWRKALQIAKDVQETHQATIIGKVAECVVKIRARIHTTEDRQEFGPYLLTALRKTPASEIEKIGNALMARRYFGSALLIFRSIQPSNALLGAIFRCQIGKSDLEGARHTITDLVARGAPEIDVETLNLTLQETTGNWPEAMAILKRRCQKTPGNLDLRQRYAVACAEAGEFDQAHDNYLLLIRSVKGEAAVRALAALELSRLNVSAARSLLEAYMVTAPNARGLHRLMADCLAYENRLHEACDYYFKALQLDALDTPSYTKLRELEGELEAAGSAPDPLWSTRFRAHIATVQDHTVETLLGQGRLGLLDNDLETMRHNAARAVALYPNDMRAYAWLGHAIAWGGGKDGGRRDAAEIRSIISHYRASISAGAEDGWWTSYDFVRSLAFLGQTSEIRSLLREQYHTLFVGQKHRTGWPRFMAGAALSDLDLAFGGLRDFPRSALIRKHARNFRLADSIEGIRPNEKVLFLSEGGVGDEIRYAIPYPELAKRFPDAAFSVDERLAPLYRRSFPEVAEFLPLPRFHRKRMNRDLLDHIRDLPDQALAQFFDSKLWAKANKMDVVMPAPSVMADLRPDAASFNQGPQPRLKADPDLVAAWRKRLAPYAGTLLVGVIGTSRILEYQRIANYFTPDQFGEMYRMQGVTFVSLEYEDDEELADHIRTTFGANLLTFPDLDKMDDFDGVLALATALDCVVGVNTATIELTAFGGVDTIFAAPNATHIWRDPQGTGQDLFFDTMEVVLCDDPSDKPLLTARIVEKLAARRDRKLAHKALKPQTRKRTIAS